MKQTAGVNEGAIAEEPNPITQQGVTDFLRKNPAGFHCTQTKICLPIINRLYWKMVNGIRFSRIHVADGLIIDGHHRYLASLLAGYELEHTLSAATSATRITSWDVVEFVHEDWDTAARIAFCNEQDAAYNKIDPDKLTQLVK